MWCCVLDDADIVIDSFSVTDERKARVDFVNPFYYTSGVGLFVNDTTRLPGAWDDIEDEIICIEVMGLVHVGCSWHHRRGFSCHFW